MMALDTSSKVAIMPRSEAKQFVWFVVGRFVGFYGWMACELCNFYGLINIRVL